MVKLATFKIPEYAAIRYPIEDATNNRVVKTHSWFDHIGTDMLNHQEKTDVEPILRCEQIKVTPNVKQRAILTEWMNIRTENLQLLVS